MSKQIQPLSEKMRPLGSGHGEPINAADLPLTNQVRTNRGNVIKSNAGKEKLKIVDYRNILEEIKADAKNEVKVDSCDWISSSESEIGAALFEEGGGTHDNGQRGEGLQKGNAVSKAFKEGFEAGKIEAAKIIRLEYEKKVQDIVKDLGSVAGEFSKEVERYNQEFDAAVVKLALAIARRIVDREIDVDEGSVLIRSREAIRKIIGVEKVKIHVSSSDEEYIREHRNELMSYADSLKEIAIEGDNKVERGGCIIESDLGNIDARISTQFEIVEEALLGLVK